MNRGVLALVGLLATAQGIAGRRWASFEGVRLGGWVDEALALGGSCRAALAIRDLEPTYNPVSFAAFAFGHTLPHGHRWQDSTAVATALANASVCRVTLFDDRAVMLVLAFDRRIAAVVVLFDGGQPQLTIDSVRVRARAAWGTPTHPAPTLDTWWGDRYRAYLLVPRLHEGEGRPQLIMVDLAACTAFDRRVHRGGAGGAPAGC